MHETNIRHTPIEVAPGFETIYAHAVEIPVGARVVHVSGQIGRTADGSVPKDFEGQFRLAISNLEEVLGGAGMAIADIAKLTFFVTDPAHLGPLGVIRREQLAISPAVTTLIVAGLAGPDLLVEVEAIAAKS